jgi:regulator of cell morphogenesis and NO signaling
MVGTYQREISMRTLAAARVIDVRELEGPDHCQAVLGAFDLLAPGETLVVVSDHAPAKLLRHLQADRKGEFEWSPLEARPGRFRTEIARRDARREALRGVSEALAWDHDRLEAIEERAFRFYAAGEAVSARAAWAEFDLGLRRHIRFEEDILFPAFERVTGMPPGAGPTLVMRLEHLRIGELLDAIGSALHGSRAPLPLRAELHKVLGEHNEKEELVLYPMTDQSLGAAESDALVARIQSS